MKRILTISMMVLIMTPLFFGQARAEELDGQILGIFESEKMEQGLHEEELEIIGKLEGERFDVFSAMRRLWEAFLSAIREQMQENLGFAAQLLALILFFAFAGAVCSDEKIRNIIEICTVCTASTLLVGNLDSIVSQTLQTVYRLSDYSRAALPVAYTAAAASGAVGSSAVRYAAACLALEVMMSLSQKAVVPLVYTTLALGLTDVIYPNPILNAVSELSKWTAKTIMTGAVLAFTTYIGLSSVISTSADAAAVKAARMVLSGALPVVGGMLSDASAAVLSAAAVIRSCTGAFGLVAVCVLCAGPFAFLAVKRFLFKAVSAAAQSVQSARLHRLFSCVGNAIGMLTGLLGCNAVMLFLSFMAAMKAVTV